MSTQRRPQRAAVANHTGAPHRAAVANHADDDDDGDLSQGSDSDEPGMNINDGAQRFIDDNKTESTYQNYRGTLKLFREYLVANNLQKYLTPSQEWVLLDLPTEIVKCFSKEKLANLDPAVVVNFISDRSTIKAGKRQGQTRSYESCSLPRSAIKHLLKKLGLPPPYSWELPVSELHWALRCSRLRLHQHFYIYIYIYIDVCVWVTISASPTTAAQR